MKRLKELTDKDFEDIQETEFIIRIFDYVADERYFEIKIVYSIKEALNKIKKLCKGGKNIACYLSYDDMGMMDNGEIIIRYIVITEKETERYRNIYDMVNNLIPIDENDIETIRDIIQLGEETIYGKVYLIAIDGKIYADEQIYFTHKMLIEEKSQKVICKRTYSYMGIISFTDLSYRKIPDLDIRLFNVTGVRHCRIKNLNVKILSNSCLDLTSCKIDELRVICSDQYEDIGVSLNKCEVEKLIIDLTGIKNEDIFIKCYNLMDNSSIIKVTKVIINRKLYKQVYGGRIIDNKELKKISMITDILDITEISIED